MTKTIKTTLVKESETEVWDQESESFVLNQPSKFFVTLATGDLLFLHTRDRLAAQGYVDSEYGKGFYTVKQCKQGSGSGNYTCTGSTTRKCTNPRLKGLK